MIRLPFALARGFVAAETLDDTIPVVRQLCNKGLLTTVDLLGEHIVRKDLALKSRDAYIRLLRALALEPGLDRNISIKLSMIGQVINEDFCLENLRALLEEARLVNGFVRLDMEGSSVLDSTLRIFESVFPDYRAHVGIVLQAYLKRTVEDVDHMCDLGARVRLCKVPTGSRRRLRTSACCKSAPGTSLACRNCFSTDIIPQSPPTMMH